MLANNLHPRRRRRLFNNSEHPGGRAGGPAVMVFAITRQTLYRQSCLSDVRRVFIQRLAIVSQNGQSICENQAQSGISLNVIKNPRGALIQINVNPSIRPYSCFTKERILICSVQIGRSSISEYRKGSTMRSLSHSITIPPPFVRSAAFAILLGATMLASPLGVARADPAINAAIQLAQATAPQSSAGAGATEAKAETVEQRITALHAALKITPDQEAKWKAVAVAMRENAAAMDKLLAETSATPAKNMTAVEDLKMYQKFAQAHVNGLKNLIDDFQVLYAAMPDVQKKNADEVFKTAGQ